MEGFVKETEGYETVIFAGGIAPCLEGEDMPVRVPGFRGGDRETIQLPQVQTFISILKSEEFHRRLEETGGYGWHQAGRIINIG